MLRSSALTCLAKYKEVALQPLLETIFPQFLTWTVNLWLLKWARLPLFLPAQSKENFLVNLALGRILADALHSRTRTCCNELIKMGMMLKQSVPQLYRRYFSVTKEQKRLQGRSREIFQLTRQPWISEEFWGIHFSSCAKPSGNLPIGTHLDISPPKHKKYGSNLCMCLQE